MNANSCKPSDHPYDAGMHTLMCIAVLTSGICSDEYCTVYDMNMRPSRGNCLVSDSVSSVRAAVLNPQVSIQFLRAQGAPVWVSGHFAISSIDNGHHKITKDCVKVLAREDVWLKRKVREAIEIKIGQPAMNRDQGYELPPSTMNFCCHVIVVKAIT